MQQRKSLLTRKIPWARSGLYIVGTGRPVRCPTGLRAIWSHKDAFRWSPQPAQSTTGDQAFGDSLMSTSLSCQGMLELPNRRYSVVTLCSGQRGGVSVAASLIQRR